MTFIGDNIPYLEYMRGLFSVCSHKTVVELGPFTGWHSKLILSYNPTSLTLVDANPQAIDYLNSHFASPTTTVITSDVHQFYHTSHKADVVVCCGVLYHLHSPFMLLEQIVNQSDPDVIILDSTPSMNHPTVNVEPDNYPGNRYTVNNWKSCGLNVVVHYDDIFRAMANLGYSPTHVDKKITRFGEVSKQGWVAIFRKVTDDC